MTAKEIIKAIAQLPAEEKDKLFLAIMEDFEDEMMKSPAFFQQATSIMRQYMEKMRNSGIDVRVFEEIAKK
ncbi:MAG: hypothetical protein OEV42_13700 [Deltaproteobacteria bacterium]|nr:hypothetical protein [Deltaproteobacteria bacterium]